MNSIHSKLLKSLKPHRKTLKVVAKASGVSWSTLKKVTNGEIGNPGVNTIQPVINWLTKRGEWV